MHVEPVWQSLKQEIKKLGFGTGHSEASWNRELSRTLGLKSVPSLVGIVNGVVYHFSGEYSIKNMREFVRKLVPSKLVARVSRDDFNSTMQDALSENKVFALFVTSRPTISLRFQMPCFQMNSFIKCATVNTSKFKYFSMSTVESYFFKILFLRTNDLHINTTQSYFEFLFFSKIKLTFRLSYC
jgi:hypothetical protein